MPDNYLDREKGLMRSEIEVFAGLVRSTHAVDALEIGMALASSSETILTELKSTGGTLTSIDPFQLVPPPDGFGGEGVRRVQASGLAASHTLLAKPDYIALPELVTAARTFDFIFIDGYHAVDYVFLDAFYSDLLLRPGGTMLFHDSGTPAVNTVCRFLSASGRYELVGPSLALNYRSLAPRVARRLYFTLSGRAAEGHQRRDRWKSLAAFRKTADGLTPEFVAPGL